MSSSPAFPQVWKSGAAIRTGSAARSGMTERIAAAGPRLEIGGLRAPFGVPVVPEVNTIIRPSRLGRAGVGPGVSARASNSASASTVRSAGTRSRNSSSATIVCRSSSSAISASWSGDSPVLSSTTSAPSVDAVIIASTGVRWLRQSTPIRAPSVTPRAASPRAMPSVRVWTSA